MPVFGNKTNLMGNVKELSEGQSFTLFCHATGMPIPQITWLKVIYNNIEKHVLCCSRIFT